MKAEDVQFLLKAVLFTLALFGAALLLTGCSSTKYYECLARDATSRPCNW